MNDIGYCCSADTSRTLRKFQLLVGVANGSSVVRVSHRYKLYKFTYDTRELEYYYIDYATEPGNVF
jgi:hypothetical protein